MIEATKHEAYELLKGKYARVGLDYVILVETEPYEGEKTHKKAVLFALDIITKRYAETDYKIITQEEKMEGTRLSTEEFFQLPPESYKNRSAKNRSFTIPKPLPYWFAFLEPPAGTKYTTADFVQFNEKLFAHRESLELYSWNDTFSSYFDAGKEWWGTALWSVYDKSSGQMVVIGASLSD